MTLGSTPSPRRTLNNVKAALVDTARTPGVGGGLCTTSYGHGIVDAAAAAAYSGAGTVTQAGRAKGRRA